MDKAPDGLADAVESLRELILAGEHYRQMVSQHLDIDISQTQALSYLYSRGNLGQSELGALLGYNTSSMTSLVDRLERSRLARRIPHPTDRRRSTVELTDAGRDAVRSTGRWFLHAFDHVAREELPGVAATLNAVAADLRAFAFRMSGGLPPQ
jgi:DNA-binding MarR family transcriptional regulator